MPQRNRPAPHSDLTAREQQVLALIATLASNRAIATALGCSVKTVEFHVSNIFRKTSTASRLELVVKLLGAGTAANAPDGDAAGGGAAGGKPTRD